MAWVSIDSQRTTEELLEHFRQMRIDEGLPPDPEPRPEVVSVPLSLALIERMKPFEAIVIKYTKVLAEGTAPRVDTDKLTQYEEWARLLSYSRGRWCSWYGSGAIGMLHQIERVNQAIEAEDESLDVVAEMRHAHFIIDCFLKRDSIRDDEYDYSKETGVYPKAEKERLLSDPAALQAAIDEALAQLHPKEEDDLYE